MSPCSLDDIAKLHLFVEMDDRILYQMTMVDDFFIVTIVTFIQVKNPKYIFN